MERTPKERVVFDADVYDEDFLREYLSDDYEMYKDELEVDFDTYVEERSDRLFEVRDEDYREEMAALTSYFQGKPSDMSSEISEQAGNPIIVSGTIGRYDVRLNEYVHFNPRYTVVAIDAWIEDVPDTSASRWVGEVGERVEHETTYIGYGSYERDAFSGYGTETVYIYKFADSDGNLLVWKTTAYLEREDEDGFLVPIKRGTRLTLRGTVKSHDEYRGIKQTFLSRCRVTPRSS